MQKILKYLLQKRLFSLKAEGNSMFPILHSGDTVYFRKTPPNKIKVNDFVLVMNNNKLFTHRVIYKKILRQAQDDGGGGFLITKGDNNPKSDGKIYPKQIISKVVKVKRNRKEFDPNQIYLLQSSLYLQEIIKIKRKFEKKSIDFVFLKGLPLHLSYENTHPRRIYADCDVLVNKNDFQKAENILLKQEYKKQDSSMSKGQQNIKDKESELAYYKIINGFVVMFDLHLEVVFMMTQLGRLEALYPQKLIDKLTEKCLKTKRGIKINGESFQTLDMRYLILYLALHFFHHNYQGAFRLEFLDKIIRKSKRDSDLINQLIESVKIYRLQNFVYPAFVLLKKYYQTPIPISFLKSIRPNFMYGSVATDPYIKNLNIFDDEPRVKAGINRFKNLFFLSPQPLWRKIFVFANKQVIYSIIWIVWNKVKKLLKLKDACPKHSHH